MIIWCMCSTYSSSVYSPGVGTVNIISSWQQKNHKFPIHGRVYKHTSLGLSSAMHYLPSLLIVNFWKVGYILPGLTLSGFSQPGFHHGSALFSLEATCRVVWDIHVLTLAEGVWVWLAVLHEEDTYHVCRVMVGRCPQEIGWGQSLRLISQGWYMSITSVHAVDIYLIPRHWTLHSGIPPSSVAVEHPWAVALFLFCPVAIAAGGYSISPRCQ